MTNGEAIQVLLQDLDAVGSKMPKVAAAYEVAIDSMSNASFATGEDFVLTAVKSMCDEYNGFGYFVVDGNEISVGQMVEALEANTDVGQKFRNDVIQMVLAYMMKFRGDEEDEHARR